MKLDEHTLKAPAKEVLEAFLHLTSNRDWKTIVAWLKHMHVQTAIYATHISGESGLWSEGQAQALEMLIDSIDNAETLLEAAEKEKGNNQGKVIV